LEELVFKSLSNDKNWLTTSFVLFLLLCLYGVQAQTTQTKLEQISLDNTSQFSITSKYVEGETYVIQIGLPIGYSSFQKSYPVLHVLDGDVFFGMAKEVTTWLMFNQEIMEIIVIGKVSDLYHF
jgi:hypothetical protein